MSNRFTLRSSTGFLDVVLESDPVQANIDSLKTSAKEHLKNK
jgi:hypothetical protein